jgi:gliding motility-associated-like protein
MKKFILIGLVLLFVIPCEAKHIIGGEMIYKYLGKGSAPNTSKYIITLKLFRDENAPPDAAAMPENVYIGIFNNDNGQQVQGPFPWWDVPKQTELPVTVNPFPPCIQNAPRLSYHVGLYTVTVELPDNTTGYTATYQTCCRISPLSNANTFGGTGTGSTYTCLIPPANDNAPEFSTSIDAICGGKPFTLQFSAVDADNDSLVYRFAEAYDGGSFRNSGNSNPAPPPYSSVPYYNGFTAETPLGDATIDSRTGIISGRAPEVGRYVVGVAVTSYRNGVLINEHRKDFIVNVTNCDFAGAKLDPKPVSCDGFNVSFSNDDFSPLNKTFYWSFGDPSTGTADTSTLASPVHVYSDTGVYVYKLVVNRGQQCSDSAIQTVKVYPGFFPAFTIGGKCKNSPIQFIDKSTTNYGVVDSWSWDFGDPVATGDSSHLKNPSYTYENGGNYPVILSITSSKGCYKAFKDTISVLEKPEFEITNDTLICNTDALQLSAQGQGTVTWSPNYNISSTTGFSPVVTPKISTTYYATLSESDGCAATDSVKVDVVSFVSLKAGNDTTLCLSDTMQMNVISNGLHFLWTPANSLSSDTAKNPTAVPLETTRYHIVASIGKCSSSDDVTIKVVPYPAARAGNDTAICYPQTVQLLASGGSIYLWTPPAFLNNSTISNPIASPPESIRYVVQVNDVLGCPKAVYDTIVINVERPVADAGPRDTVVVVNQPLQLNGSGAAESFSWSPSTGLDNPDIPNPVSILSNNQQYILTIHSSAGCASSDTIDIIVYKIKPGILVPNSFTPNGDGLNDIFKPVLVGMKSLHYFRVFNRAGQLIFSTKEQGHGWDGSFRGSPQDSDVFVWIVEGEDYLGKTLVEKGSVTLIR